MSSNIYLYAAYAVFIIAISSYFLRTQTQQKSLKKELEEL